MAEGGIDEKIMNQAPCAVYLLKQRHGKELRPLGDLVISLKL